MGIQYFPVQRRNIMFGEGFWETIVIPIRMFFQGKDASVQYFDGVLNPILIIMLPFAFLNRKLNRDKIFFLLFPVFFFFMAYSLTVIRIRYILPDDVRIFLMFLGRRGYYLDRPYYHEKSFGMNTINGMVKASAGKQDFQHICNLWIVLIF
jgi:hypothetical protein